MGTVMLKVGDMKLMTDYYQRALGLDIVAEQDGGLYLGRRQKPLVHLAPAPGLNLPCPRRGRPLPHRPALRGPALAGRHRRHRGPVSSRSPSPAAPTTSSARPSTSTTPKATASSCTGTGPREAWSWEGKNVVMDSLALPPQRYLEQHLTEESVAGQRETAAGVGHVHLQVGDVQSAHDFYVGTLGFEKTAGWHGQALFVSAGGYHHHMAMNVWNSRGAGPRRDTLGLGEVLIEVPSGDDVGALADRLKIAGVQSHHTGAELRFEDPWRNRIRVAVR